MDFPFLLFGGAIFILMGVFFIAIILIIKKYYDEKDTIMEEIKVIIRYIAMRLMEKNTIVRVVWETIKKKMSIRTIL